MSRPRKDRLQTSLEAGMVNYSTCCAGPITLVDLIYLVSKATKCEGYDYMMMIWWNIVNKTCRESSGHKVVMFSRKSCCWCTELHRIIKHVHESIGTGWLQPANIVHHQCICTACNICTLCFKKVMSLKSSLNNWVKDEQIWISKKCYVRRL